MNEAPRKLADEADGLSQLKSLLFRGEADRLKAVEASVEALDGRVGDAPRLEAATAEILVEALRRAEVARHRDLARAIAPVVVASMRDEIRNSREAMVEALYPIAGQMVVAAVSNALREALAAVNQRIDRLTSLDRWKLRIRARLSGRSASELALSGATPPRLSRVLFLERDSGVLLASWRADGQTEQRGQMIGGLLAALTGFSRDALGEGEGGGELRTLEFGGRDIYVHASPKHLIASEVTSPLRADQKASLDANCLAWLAQYSRDGAASDAVFGEFIANAMERARPAAKKGLGWPLKILAALLALAIIGFVGRAILREWREHALQAAMDRVVAARPALAAYPLAIAVDHAAARVDLRGLAPSRADVEALSSALRAAAGGYAIAPGVGIIATEGALGEEVARASAGIEALGRKLDALERTGATSAALAAARAEQASLAAATGELAKKLAAADKGLSDLRARADAPRARLAALIDGFAVFFDGDRAREAPGMSERLDAIASALNETGQSLRIVGFADETGGASVNQAITRRRAEVVAELLEQRGVAKDRLTIVGRATATPIFDSAPGVRERDRRAVFELPYVGEAAP